MQRLTARSTWVAGVALVCLLLAACGGTAAAGSTSMPPRTLPTPTPRASALTGCASRAPAGGAPTADVVVTQGGGLNSPPISVRKGQRLEIQLSASDSWGLTIQDAGQSLTAQPDNGWLDASAHMCVWQFTASSAGRATLLFMGRMVCPPGAMCAAFVIDRQFVIAVAA